VLNERESTMIIISHDRHFLNQVCTHMADLDYRRLLKVYPGNYDDYMEAATQARERLSAANAKRQGKDRRPAGLRAPLLRQRLQGQAGHQPPEVDRQDQARGREALQPPVPLDPLRLRRAGKAAPPGLPKWKTSSFGYEPGVPVIKNLTCTSPPATEGRHHRRERRRQDHPAAPAHG
jgi:ATPase subunit of ABC transporter with duplicated ATPase domains